MKTLQEHRNIMKKNKDAVNALIASFNTDTVASLANWTQDQFTAQYRISDAAALKFAVSVMVEFHQDCQMEIDISWEDLKRDYDFDEIFNDTFQD